MSGEALVLNADDDQGNWPSARATLRNSPHEIMKAT
jgi:hypothetical protein